jgi:hypothetical protein
MSLFLNVHTLDNGSVDALLLDRTAHSMTGARCLKHWPQARAADRSAGRGDGTRLRP